jgi:hypothetical protein
MTFELKMTKDSPHTSIHAAAYGLSHPSPSANTGKADIIPSSHSFFRTTTKRFNRFPPPARLKRLSNRRTKQRSEVSRPSSKKRGRNTPPKRKPPPDRARFTMTHRGGPPRIAPGRAAGYFPGRARLPNSPRTSPRDGDGAAQNRQAWNLPIQLDRDVGAALLRGRASFSATPISTLPAKTSGRSRAARFERDELPLALVLSQSFIH